MSVSAISFMGASFPAMEIDLFPNTDKEETVLVSITALENRLRDCIRSCGDGCAEAIELDEKIFYYLTGEEFMLPEDEVREILENAIS